jgi:uncharacterized membrane protein
VWHAWWSAPLTDASFTRSLNPLCRTADLGQAHAMVALITALGVALAAPIPLAEKRVWDDCLLSYAQIESFGTKTEVRIALDAVAACGAERQAYAKALIRSFQHTASRDNTAINQTVEQMEVDRNAAMRRVIAFVLRNRQSQKK